MQGFIRYVVKSNKWRFNPAYSGTEQSDFGKLLSNCGTYGSAM
jgi:hypothetical protein